MIVSNGVEMFPIKITGGSGKVMNLDDYPMTGVIDLSGADVFCPDVVVRTTVAEIKNLMRDMSKNEAKNLFPQVWNAIKTVNTDELYARGGQKWTDFMNDILLYYVARFKIFNTPMPMIS